MLPTYSFEARLQRTLSSLRMSLDVFSAVATLAGITGASKTRLQAALSDAGRALPNEIVAKLSPLIASINALVDSAKPLRIEVRSPVELYIWAKQFRDGTLKVNVSQTNHN
jgi:hypothetical protein